MKTEHRVIIAGTRNFIDYALLKETLDNLFSEWGKPTIILSGHASGADTLGEQYADENDIPKEIYKAEWDKYGRSAGPIRNGVMVDNADALVAFHISNSSGTADVIAKARKKGLKVKVVKI